MSEILFRAKRIDNGEWVEGYYLKTTLGKDIEPSDVIFVPFKINRSGQWGWIKVLPETLCQYTGMVDKNGNRIWENDIVSAWSEGKYATGMVKQRIDGLYIIYPAYQHNEFWGLCPDKNRKTNVEVIGNVFDDKYLLAETDCCREQEQETEDSHGE